MIKNEMTFGGVDFGTQFHAYVATSNFLDGASKDMDSVKVLGRSGNLQVNNNRYNNITLRVLVYVTENMKTNMDAMRSFLESCHGYQVYTESLNPDEWRMASFKQAFTPDLYDINGGTVELEFDCMPQRYKNSGKESTDISSESTTASGNPVSISNPSGLTALTGLNVDIQPVQDLNCYDHPWVGGANINKLPCGEVFTHTEYGITLTSDGRGRYTLSGTATENFSFPFDIPEVTLPSSTYVHLMNDKKGSGTGTINLDFYNNTTRVDWLGFSIVNRIYNGSSAMANKVINKLRVRVNAGEVIDGTLTFTPMILETDAVTDFTPWQNICPITGHTSASVTRTGKNLLNQSDFVHGSISGTGADFNSNTRLRSPFVMVESGKTYSVQCNSELLIYEMHRYDASKNWLGRTASNRVSSTFTVDSDTRYMKFLVRKSNNAAIELNELTAFQLEEGNVTSYEPYQGQTVTVDLNGTRYGGTLDVLTGVLTVNTVSKEVRSFNWTDRFASQNRVYATVAALFGEDFRPYYYPTEDEMLADGKNRCDKMPVENTSQTATRPSVTIGVVNGYFYLNGVQHISSDVTDKATLNTWLDNNPLQVTYKLAEPQTVQLTAQQVSLLTGTNIISTDMESLTVTIASPAELENPTLFESKPIIRVYGNGTLNINDIYITVANSPYTYIDIDCELMDCYHGSNNANSYVSFSTTDYVTLRSGTNYFSYSGFSQVSITPRWYTI